MHLVSWLPLVRKKKGCELQRGNQGTSKATDKQGNHRFWSAQDSSNSCLLYWCKF